MIAAALEALHPRAAVATADLGALAQEMEHFDPHMVVCSTPNTIDPGSRIAWMELLLDPARSAKVCIDGRQWETPNPTLEVLLALIDEAENLVKQEDRPRCC